MEFNQPTFKNFLKQIKFDIYLDFANICQHILSPESDECDKNIYIKKLCKLLERPPKGKNLALGNQINRKALLNFCQNYESGQRIYPNLFNESLKYVQNKLIEKEAIFYKIYKNQK